MLTQHSDRGRTVRRFRRIDATASLDAVADAVADDGLGLLAGRERLPRAACVPVHEDGPTAGAPHGAP
jgi:hypothetical protein